MCKSVSSSSVHDTDMSLHRRLDEQTVLVTAVIVVVNHGLQIIRIFLHRLENLIFLGTKPLNLLHPFIFLCSIGISLPDEFFLPHVSIGIWLASSTGSNCLIPVPKRLSIPAAMISNVVFIVFSPSFFYQIDFIIVFILHISADHRSLPTAHHEEVCEGLSSHRVRIHTVLFFLIQTLIRQHSTFGAYLVHFAFTV